MLMIPKIKGLDKFCGSAIIMVLISSSQTKQGFWHECLVGWPNGESMHFYIVIH